MSILVVYTQSTQGRVALRTAVEEARVRSSELKIAPLPMPGSGGTRTADEAEIRDELAAAGCPDPAAPVIVDTRPEADIGDEVLRLATAEQAELVVIGLRQSSPNGKLHLGSHVQRVLLELRCPLLTITA